MEVMYEEGRKALEKVEKIAFSGERSCGGRKSWKDKIKERERDWEDEHPTNWAPQITS